MSASPSVPVPPNAAASATVSSDAPAAAPPARAASGAAPTHITLGAGVQGGPTPCDAGELVRMVKAGDLAALDRITRCHGQRLLAVGRRYCRSEAEAEDAVQDALLSAGTHLTSFRGDGSLEGWLVRMVANACHHMRRGRKNDYRLHDAEAVLTSAAASPEDQAMVGQLSTALGDALLELTPTNRTIVLLAEAEGWTGPEIAERLDMSAGNVRVRLHRARAQLRTRLEALDTRP